MNINFTFLYLRALAIVLVFHLSTSISLAQYTSGYIVFMKGDTLQGQLDDKDWEVSPDHIYFKETSESEPTRIEAEQLEMFFIKSTNRRFVSREIGIVEVYKNDVFAERASLLPKKNAFVFLETILLGPVASLYKLINANLEPHFYIETPSRIIELGSYSYFREINGSQYVETIEDYKDKLKSVCSSAPSFNKKLPNYTEEGLKKYLMKYNDCFHAKTILYNSETRKTTFDLMVGGGVELISHLGPKIIYGLGVRMNLPYKNHRRFVRANVFFIPHKDIYGEKVTVKWMSLGIGSYFGEKKIQPYLYVGAVDVISATDEGAAAALTMSAGISYKKMIEFEFGHWLTPFPIFENENIFQVPSITVRYHPRIFRNR
jgi:hypothetical protein